LLTYGIAAGAIIVGLAAVGFSIAARKSMLECAVTAVFLAVAGLLFSINIVVSANRSKTATDAEAKAAAKEDEVRREREKAEAAEKAAAEKLKKAEEAPAKAQEILKRAEEAQAKAEEAPRKAAELLNQVKAEETKLDKRRKQLDEQSDALAAERAKVEDTKAKIEEQSREIEASKKAAVALAKKAEEDKVRAREAQLKAEQKEREARDLLKTVEDTLKGAALQLKDKKPAVRIKTANAIAKLPQFPEAKEILGEPLVEAMLDPTPAVRNAANEALAKIDPAIHPHVLTLLIGQDKRRAGKELEGLGKEARNALPVLIFSYRSNAGDGGVGADQLPLIRAIWLDTLVRVAPKDKRVVDIVLAEVANNKDRFHFAREKAISLLDSVAADKKDKVKALMTVFDDRVLAVTAITAVEAIGAPDADAAIPALKKLKSSSDDTVRSAATKALSDIEKAK
jgi:hypothetical protein